MFKLIFVKSLTYLLFVLFSLKIGYSQTYIYEHFGVDEGLPSSEVYDVYQDKLGYIWFATDKGLSRYNGYEFKNFTTNDGLPGNTILDFYPQEDGRIFCLEYHSNTLFYFDTVFDGFKMYAFNNILKKNIASNTVVKSIHVDSTDCLMIGGYNLDGFLEISNEGKVIKHFNEHRIPDVSFPERIPNLKLGILRDSKTFSSLYADYKTNDTLITIPLKNTITSRLDVEVLNKNQFAFIDRKLGIATASGTVSYYENEQNPIGIKRIDDNTFWVGYYSNGAEIRSVSGEVIERFLSQKSVSSFLIDAEGSYWFTTLDDGVFQIKNPDVKQFTESHITSLVKDNNSNLFAGHHNGNITKIKHLKSDKLYIGLNDRPAYVEFNEKQSQVYGSSDYYMHNLTRKKEPIYILGIRKSSEHILDPLVSVAANGFKAVVNDSIVFYQVDIRTEDVCFRNDTVFIATPAGLFIKDKDIIKPNHKSSILKSRLYDIDVERTTNIMYIASQRHGVIVYGNSIYSIGKEDGLTDNIVSEVHIENDSTVWACTNSGLNRINFKSDKTISINTITKADGLLSNDINDVEIVNDTVWVATKRGLCYFKKDMIDKKENLNLLSLSLKEVHVNNTRTKEKDIKLNYNQNSIDFKIEAISNRNTNKIDYYYRLKQIDSAWTKTTNRLIRFPALSPGNYTFEAKANIFNNPNNLIATYNFKIRPPFWKSWWFYSLCFLLVSALVYLFFRIRVLTYNQDVFRELIRLAIKRLKRKELFYKFRSNGEDFKILTHDILYIHSQGNYLDIVTTKKTYTIRCKIGDFISSTPDALEYLRVHRSYIIRIDQVSSKGKNWVVIRDQKIPVGETYLSQLNNIQF